MAGFLDCLGTNVFAPQMRLIHLAHIHFAKSYSGTGPVSLDQFLKDLKADGGCVITHALKLIEVIWWRNQEKFPPTVDPVISESIVGDPLGAAHVAYPPNHADVHGSGSGRRVELHHPFKRVLAKPNFYLVMQPVIPKNVDEPIL